MQSETHAEQGPPPKDLQEALERGLLSLPKGVELVRTDDGFKQVQNRRSNNKWLGSENPRSKINPNGFDPIERAAKLAKQAVTDKLTQVVNRHEH